MITEDYCSPDLAQALQLQAKELFEYYHLVDDEKIGLYKTVTHQRARRWLRKTHRIDIIIDISNPSAKDRKYYCMIWDGNNNSYILELFDSYEEAVEAALMYCLENLI